MNLSALNIVTISKSIYFLIFINCGKVGCKNIKLGKNNPIRFINDKVEPFFHQAEGGGKSLILSLNVMKN